MVKDFMNIGSSPWDEDCVQVGQDNYYKESLKECRAFLNQILRVVGKEPEGARLVIKSFPHDFGTYHEVVCWFDDDASMEYALECEGSDKLNYWDEKAKAELGLENASSL